MEKSADAARSPVETNHLVTTPRRNYLHPSGKQVLNKLC